jgi:hypothetical protein
MESLVFFTALCFGTRIEKRAIYHPTEYTMAVKKFYPSISVTSKKKFVSHTLLSL